VGRKMKRKGQKDKGIKHKERRHSCGWAAWPIIATMGLS